MRRKGRRTGQKEASENKKKRTSVKISQGFILFFKRFCVPFNIRSKNVEPNGETI